MGKILVDDDTGEVTENIVYYRTAKQQEAWTEQQEKRRQREKEEQEHKLREYAKQMGIEGINPDYKEFGPFVWLMYAPMSDLNYGLNNMDMVRLIVLSTYMGYDGYLRLSKKVKLKTKDIPNALDISEPSAKVFMSNLKSMSVFIVNTPSGSNLPKYVFPL